MFDSFFKEKMAPLTLRLTLGLVCAYHGYVKIMFAGGTAWYPGMPTFWQLAISWAEFAAGLAVFLGFRCRLAAAVASISMAATLVWWQGWNLFRLPIRTLEPYVILLLLGVSVIFLGAGELSLDGRWGAGRTSLSRAGRKAA